MTRDAFNNHNYWISNRLYDMHVNNYCGINKYCYDRNMINEFITNVLINLHDHMPDYDYRTIKELDSGYIFDMHTTNDEIVIILDNIFKHLDLV